MEPSDTFLMGDKVISTTPERENNEFIKSSVDDLVPILRESEVTSVYDDLECSMPLYSPPSPRLDVLGERKVDIDLPLGEHLDTLSIGDREIDFNSRDIETNDLIPVPRVFDEPLGNSDSVPRSYDVTFSNPLFDFNDDYTLCYDNPLFDEEFEDISSLDPPESTLVIDESSLLVTPPPASKVMEIPSFGFHHMPSPRLAAYSPTEVMDIHKKTKTRQKPDKTEHEIGKSVENQSQRHMHLSEPTPTQVNGPITPSDIQHSAACSDLRVLQIGIRAKVIENQDMDAPIFPTLVTSSKESHDDTVDIGVDRVHPIPVAEVAFPATTVRQTWRRHPRHL
ncbi:hypothetical protein Tco_0432626 [Tanacetum coccineum]